MSHPPYPNGNQGNPDVPEWASFFDLQQYHAFMAAVAAYFQAIGVTFVQDGGVLRIKDEKIDFEQMGLLNVAQQCAQKPTTDDYERVVRNHFDVMRKSQSFLEEFNRNLGDFSFIKPFLATRIYPRQYVNTVGIDKLVCRQLAGDVYVMLVYDLPQSISTIQIKDADTWGVPMEELYAIGLENVKANYDLSIKQLDIDLPLQAVIKDHFFGGSILLDLANHPDVVGRYGTLVGIPHRHTTLLFAIDDMEVVRAVSMLISMCYGMNNEGPGPISPELLWYRDGKFELLPYKVTENKLQFFPPASFTAMLNELAGGD